MTTRTSDPATTGRLGTETITVGYDNATIIDGLSVMIPDGSFTVIVGPNACGKSTLLRALSRLLKPSRGHVLLDGKNVQQWNGKAFAREVGLLPQQSIAPDGITIVDLVSRGRFPYQSMFAQWTDKDEEAVRYALEATRLTDLSTRPVAELSGGQRQRVWIAMALAQDTPVLLLDEPTTYLDLAHQLEVLDLCSDLNRRGVTLVAVLHDLNQAARYATHLIAMRSGTVVAEGPPTDVVTVENVENVFGVASRIIADPETGTPMVVPLASGAVKVSALPGDTANYQAARSHAARLQTESTDS
ncbi:ABC transporter ATP-binding protein [Gordonia humi]|uniref:Iron complex transport system ATP-binding protein n=1 Tax=Gordonia humi TaxID=686429 RepID=A0A840EYA6_9ACTN|nr:iron complex transport system ATP-binding protein [Gordonia humi]